jgi:hypothetical protein
MLTLNSYMSNMLSALSQVDEKDINVNSVAICAPYYPNGADKNVGYPWTDGLAAGEGSNTSALVWSGNGWADGEDNLVRIQSSHHGELSNPLKYPYNTRTVSSYETLDQLALYFADKSIYPNMQQIIFAGHSLGAQAVNRYAAVANELNTTPKITYYIANPNGFLWFNDSRPLSTASCPEYNDWRNGLDNYTNSYGADLVAQGYTAVLDRYNDQTIAYGRGVRDFGDQSTDCGPYSTGNNRNERFFNFIKDFPVSCTVGGACSTIDYVQAGHDASAMFASSAGLARLFTDNFNGTGNIAYDKGYPRKQTGDDPYPNPAEDSTVPTVVEYYAGNMSYAGCYTDQTPLSLAYEAYDKTTNTVELCTTTCDAAGYTIAGLEYGSQCFCGNTLGYMAIKDVDQGCTTACAG